MKKIIPLVLIGLIALFVVRRQRSAKAEADLWREATTPGV
ncbi:MAG TPA: DLW-39 family protein [Pseudonocardiaceae bacterium]